MGRKTHSPQTNKKEVGSRFEVACETYITSVVANEKEEYQSNLQPFSVREREIRAKIGESLHLFQQRFSRGYQALIDEMRHGIDVQVDLKKLEMFRDSDLLLKALEEGQSIYQLLGFTEKSLNVFHHAASRLIENRAFEKACDAYYFLATIAPGVYQFWVNLGRCDVNLHAYESAFQEFLKAIEVDPTKDTAYVHMVDLLLKTGDSKTASDLCDAGMQFAREHKGEPWAERLRTTLEDAKKRDYVT